MRTTDLLVRFAVFAVLCGAPMVAAPEAQAAPWRNDVRFGQATALDGTVIELLLDIHVPAERRDSAPAIVLVHGGGWFAGAKADEAPRHVADRLAANGFVVFSIDYRLAACDTSMFTCTRYAGTGTNEDATRDVTMAIEWVHANGAKIRYGGADVRKVGLLGGSAGAQLGALAAYTSESIDALAVMSGPHHLVPTASVSPIGCAATDYDCNGWQATNSFGCRYIVCPDRYHAASSDLRVTEFSPPTLVYHSLREGGFEHARALVASLEEHAVSHRLMAPDSTCHALHCWDEPNVERNMVRFFNVLLR